MIHQELFISKPNDTDQDWERYLHHEGIPAFSLHAGPNVQRDAPDTTHRIFRALSAALKRRLGQMFR